jgi:spore coat polysaccharide biosynthesis protein SpsF
MQLINRNEQEEFWAGSFGSEYISRNNSSELLASNLNFFSKALSAITPIESCIEFGANVGMNLLALKQLFPKLDLSAIEINPTAAEELKNMIGNENVKNCSISEATFEKKYDLALIKGVLIHINPNQLNEVYNQLYNASSKYILIAEYYNPSPVSISYRGHSEKLFKRDFAGEFMGLYKDTRLVDYGFAYKRDPLFPQDDITWFLLEKK